MLEKDEKIELVSVISKGGLDNSTISITTLPDKNSARINATFMLKDGEIYQQQLAITHLGLLLLRDRINEYFTLLNMNR